jgi:hypothetical protein
VAPEQLLRLTADGSERIWRGEAQSASFASGTALVCAGKHGRRAVEVSLETGATRFLARVPAHTGELARSPGGRYLAGVVYGSPTEVDPGASRALVVDTAGPTRIHTRRLGGPYVSGEMLWVGSGRVLFVPTRYSDDRIRLYDTSLRVLSRGQRLWAVDAALHGRQLFVLSSPWVLASPRPTGTLGEVNRLPTAVAHALEMVVDGPEPAPPAPRFAMPGGLHG